MKLHTLFNALCKNYLHFSSPEQSSGRAFVILDCPSSACGVNNFSVYTLAVTVLTQSLLNLLRMIIVIMSRSSVIMGGVGSKSRSLGQILAISCLHSIGHIFDPIFLKLAQNDCLDYVCQRWWLGQKVGH